MQRRTSLLRSVHPCPAGSRKTAEVNGKNASNHKKRHLPPKPGERSLNVKRDEKLVCHRTSSSSRPPGNTKLVVGKKDAHLNHELRVSRAATMKSKCPRKTSQKLVSNPPTRKVSCSGGNTKKERAESKVYHEKIVHEARTEKVSVPKIPKILVTLVESESWRSSSSTTQRRVLHSHSGDSVETQAEAIDTDEVIDSGQTSDTLDSFECFTDSQNETTSSSDSDKFDRLQFKSQECKTGGEAERGSGTGQGHFPTLNATAAPDSLYYKIKSTSLGGRSQNQHPVGSLKIPHKSGFDLIPSSTKIGALAHSSQEEFSWIGWNSANWHYQNTQPLNRWGSAGGTVDGSANKDTSNKYPLKVGNKPISNRCNSLVHKESSRNKHVFISGATQPHILVDASGENDVTKVTYMNQTQSGEEDLSESGSRAIISQATYTQTSLTVKKEVEIGAGAECHQADREPSTVGSLSTLPPFTLPEHCTQLDCLVGDDGPNIVLSPSYEAPLAGILTTEGCQKKLSLPNEEVHLQRSEAFTPEMNENGCDEDESTICDDPILMLTNSEFVKVKNSTGIAPELVQREMREDAVTIEGQIPRKRMISIRTKNLTEKQKQQILLSLSWNPSRITESLDASLYATCLERKKLLSQPNDSKMPLSKKIIPPSSAYVKQWSLSEESVHTVVELNPTYMKAIETVISPTCPQNFVEVYYDASLCMTRAGPVRSRDVSAAVNVLIDLDQNTFSVPDLDSSVVTSDVDTVTLEHDFQNAGSQKSYLRKKKKKTSGLKYFTQFEEFFNASYTLSSPTTHERVQPESIDEADREKITFTYSSDFCRVERCELPPIPTSDVYNFLCFQKQVNVPLHAEIVQCINEGLLSDNDSDGELSNPDSKSMLHYSVAKRDIGHSSTVVSKTSKQIMNTRVIANVQSYGKNQHGAVDEVEINHSNSSRCGCNRSFTGVSHVQGPSSGRSDNCGTWGQMCSDPGRMANSGGGCSSGGQNATKCPSSCPIKSVNDISKETDINKIAASCIRRYTLEESKALATSSPMYRPNPCSPTQKSCDNMKPTASCPEEQMSTTPKMPGKKVEGQAELSLKPLSSPKCRQNYSRMRQNESVTADSSDGQCRRGLQSSSMCRPTKPQNDKCMRNSTESFDDFKSFCNPGYSQPSPPTNMQRNPANRKSGRHSPCRIAITGCERPVLPSYCPPRISNPEIDSRDRFSRRRTDYGVCGDMSKSTSRFLNTGEDGECGGSSQRLTGGEKMNRDCCQQSSRYPISPSPKWNNTTAKDVSCDCLKGNRPQDSRNEDQELRYGDDSCQKNPGGYSFKIKYTEVEEADSPSTPDASDNDCLGKPNQLQVKDRNRHSPNECSCKSPCKTPSNSQHASCKYSVEDYSRDDDEVGYQGCENFDGDTGACPDDYYGNDSSVPPFLQDESSCGRIRASKHTYEDPSAIMMQRYQQNYMSCSPDFAEFSRSPHQPQQRYMEENRGCMHQMWSDMERSPNWHGNTKNSERARCMSRAHSEECPSPYPVCKKSCGIRRKRSRKRCVSRRQPTQKCSGRPRKVVKLSRRASMELERRYAAQVPRSESSLACEAARNKRRYSPPDSCREDAIVSGENKKCLCRSSSRCVMVNPCYRNNRAALLRRKFNAAKIEEEGDPCCCVMLFRSTPVQGNDFSPGQFSESCEEREGGAFNCCMNGEQVERDPCRKPKSPCSRSPIPLNGCQPRERDTEAKKNSCRSNTPCLNIDLKGKKIMLRKFENTTNCASSELTLPENMCGKNSANNDISIALGDKTIIIKNPDSNDQVCFESKYGQWAPDSCSQSGSSCVDSVVSRHMGCTKQHRQKSPCKRKCGSAAVRKRSTPLKTCSLRETSTCERSAGIKPSVCQPSVCVALDFVPDVQEPPPKEPLNKLCTPTKSIQTKKSPGFCPCTQISNGAMPCSKRPTKVNSPPASSPQSGSLRTTPIRQWNTPPTCHPGSVGNSNSRSKSPGGYNSTPCYQPYRATAQNASADGGQRGGCKPSGCSKVSEASGEPSKKTAPTQTTKEEESKEGDKKEKCTQCAKKRSFFARMCDKFKKKCAKANAQNQTDEEVKDDDSDDTDTGDGSKCMPVNDTTSCSLRFNETRSYNCSACSTSRCVSNQSHSFMDFTDDPTTNLQLTMRSWNNTAKRIMPPVPCQRAYSLEIAKMHNGPTEVNKLKSAVVPKGKDQVPKPWQGSEKASAIKVPEASLTPRVMNASPLRSSSNSFGFPSPHENAKIQSIKAVIQAPKMPKYTFARCQNDRLLPDSRFAVISPSLHHKASIMTNGYEANENTEVEPLTPMGQKKGEKIPLQYSFQVEGRRIHVKVDKEGVFHVQEVGKPPSPPPSVNVVKSGEKLRPNTNGVNGERSTSLGSSIKATDKAGEIQSQPSSSAQLESESSGKSIGVNGTPNKCSISRSKNSPIHEILRRSIRSLSGKLTPRFSCQANQQMGNSHTVIEEEKMSGSDCEFWVPLTASEIPFQTDSKRITSKIFSTNSPLKMHNTSEESMIPCNQNDHQAILDHCRGTRRRDSTTSSQMLFRGVGTAVGSSYTDALPIVSSTKSHRSKKKKRVYANAESENVNKPVSYTHYSNYKSGDCVQKRGSWADERDCIVEDFDSYPKTKNSTLFTYDCQSDSETSIGISASMNMGKQLRLQAGYMDSAKPATPYHHFSLLGFSGGEEDSTRPHVEKQHAPIIRSNSAPLFLRKKTLSNHLFSNQGTPEPALSNSDTDNIMETPFNEDYCDLQEGTEAQAQADLTNRNNSAREEGRITTRKVSNRKIYIEEFLQQCSNFSNQNNYFKSHHEQVTHPQLTTLRSPRLLPPLNDSLVCGDVKKIVSVGSQLSNEKEKNVTMFPVEIDKDDTSLRNDGNSTESVKEKSSDSETEDPSPMSTTLTLLLEGLCGTGGGAMDSRVSTRSEPQRFNTKCKKRPCVNENVRCASKPTTNGQNKGEGKRVETSAHNCLKFKENKSFLLRKRQNCNHTSVRCMACLKKQQKQTLAKPEIHFFAKGILKHPFRKARRKDKRSPKDTIFKKSSKGSPRSETKKRRRGHLTKPSGDRCCCASLSRRWRSSSRHKTRSHASSCCNRMASFGIDTDGYGPNTSTECYTFQLVEPSVSIEQPSPDFSRCKYDPLMHQSRLFRQCSDVSVAPRSASLSQYSRKHFVSASSPKSRSVSMPTAEENEDDGEVENSTKFGKPNFIFPPPYNTSHAPGKLSLNSSSKTGECQSLMGDCMANRQSSCLKMKTALPIWDVKASTPPLLMVPSSRSQSDESSFVSSPITSLNTSEAEV
uniref:Methylcytosine dioxygenase TET n=1 Tax=Echinococcus granulosus TaxID=6210 RepID=A0A068WWM0_ECHGR|nr:hypothetical protein EgrG_000064100 [Echinococcus granulosus]